MSNRTKKFRIGARTLAIPDMPDQTITVLMFLAGAIFAVYLVLVIITVSYATVQTSLAAEVRTTEGAISSLETNYYASIAKDDALTPAEAGMVAPASVAYATEKSGSGLSFAGR